MRKRKSWLNKKIILFIFLISLLAVVFFVSNKSITGLAFYPIAKKSACNQNYAVEAKTTCPKTFTVPGPDCSPSDYPHFYTSKTRDYSYCPNPTDCVHNFKCYPDKSLQTLNNEKLFCSGAYWWDFDNRKLACEGADVCGTYTVTNKPTTWKWIKSGDFYVGEYDLLAILNGGFEQGSGADAYNWLESSYTGSQIRSSDKVHSGGFSMKVYHQVPTQKNGVAVSSDAIFYFSPQKYRLSGWVYNSLNQGDTYLDLSDFSWECSAYSKKKNDWEFISCEFTPPQQSWTKIRLVTDNYAQGTVWFDDIKIEEVDKGEECCGDDTNEYVVTGTDGSSACCSRGTNTKVVNGLCVYKLGPWNSYTGGGAVNTWSAQAVHKGGTQNFRVYEAGRLLKPKESPWGNTGLGIFSDFRKALENDVYIAPTTAIDPNTITYEMHSCISEEIYGDGYDNDCDGTIDKPLEFYGYWQLNDGRTYDNQEDAITTLEDMEATKDYTNTLMVSLNNRHLNWPKNQKTQIKEFINYAYNNNLKLIFMLLGIRDPVKQTDMENRLKITKCIIEELNDEDSTTNTNACVTDVCNGGIDTTNTGCDYDGGYIPNVYDKIFGFDVWEEPYQGWTAGIDCSHIDWWVNKVEEYFPKQKILMDVGGASTATALPCLLPANLDYPMFFFYPYRLSGSNLKYEADWDIAKRAVENLKQFGKPVTLIGQAQGARDAEEIIMPVTGTYYSGYYFDQITQTWKTGCSSGGWSTPTNLVIIPTSQEVQKFYDFAKDWGLNGLLWYFYRFTNEPMCVDSYGTNRYPEVIEEHKNIWAEEQKKQVVAR